MACYPLPHDRTDRAAKEVGLSIAIEVNAQQQSADFIYMDDREVVSRHPTRLRRGSLA